MEHCVRNNVLVYVKVIIKCAKENMVLFDKRSLFTCFEVRKYLEYMYR